MVASPGAPIVVATARFVRPGQRSGANALRYAPYRSRRNGGQIGKTKLRICKAPAGLSQATKKGREAKAESRICRRPVGRCGAGGNGHFRAGGNGHSAITIARNR